MKKIGSIGGAVACVAALAVALGALLLVGHAKEAQPQILAAAEAPEDTVTAFFEAVCGGDYELAAEMVDNCADLGLDGEADSQTSKSLQAALLASYAWEPLGTAQVEALSANMTVKFSSLDVPSITGGLREAVTAQLAYEVESARHEDDVYDESGEYRAEVVDRALAAALEELLSQASRRESQLNMTLRYTDRGWRIVWDESLASALCGGALS